MNILPLAAAPARIPGNAGVPARRRRWGRAAVAASLFAWLGAALAAAAEPFPTQLWFAKPAAKWDEAMPLGNGHIGAMVFGGTAEERIQFNESTVWTGRPHDYVRDGAGEQLAAIRAAIAAGDAQTANQLVRTKFLSNPVRQKAYQPFGDLRFQFPGHENVSAYRRELDLDTAIARVRYEVDGVTFQREVIASHPARALFLRFSADRAGKVSFSVRMDSPHGLSTTAAPADSLLALRGQVEEGGVRFESRLQVRPTGGRVTRSGDRLTVEGADSVTLVLVAASSYRNFQDISADPGALCSEFLGKLQSGNFDAWRSAHVADHQRLFRRSLVELGRTPAAELPTDERLQRAKRAGLNSDPALAALLYQYGRYLMIAASRPGGQPANLQGIWNELLAPPWESKFTTNINFEMNYWLANLTGLAECEEPFFDLTDDVVVSGSRTARKQYGASGWVLHHNTDVWRGTAPINNIDGVWPTGGAWLSHHFWERYLFTGDREFLARRAYPVMKGAAEFFVDFLVKDPKTGWLVTTPSHSPEQGPPPERGGLLQPGPTMDIQLVRALFNHTIKAAEILGKDAEFAKKLAGLAAQLPPHLIGKHGQLQEWLDDIDAPNNTHRHMSPLWALYPGADITPADPAVFAAAKKLLTWRGDGSTGWSYAWRIPLWARAGDSEFAYRQLDELVRRKMLPNLFDLCGPFQIDGNYGITAGMVELLLQSHLPTADGKSFVVQLLPALPKAWPAGRVTGLRARGGVEVDLEWSAGALSKAVVRSQLSGPVAVRLGDRDVTLAGAPGREFVLDGQLRANR